MTESSNKDADRTEIIAQIAQLSKLLGMIPADGGATVTDPVTQKSMELSQWFEDAGRSFLKLAVLLDKALDLKLQ